MTIGLYNNIWKILFDNSELSRWACKYCVKNKSGVIKSYVTNPDHAYLYCSRLEHDEKLFELFKNNTELVECYEDKIGNYKYTLKDAVISSIILDF